MTKFFSRDTFFYKSVFRLLGPFVAMNAMSLILNFCDIFMLGKTGSESEAAISAASIANQPFFLFSMVMFGSTSGAMVLASQYWGKKELRTINSIAGTTLIFLLAVCSIFIAVSYSFSHQLMRLLSNDETVIELAVIYLQIILISFIPMTLTNVFSGMLRTTENVKIPLLANFTGILINIFINYILIFGKFGFPAYGIKGAAIGTLAARIVELGIILVYVIFFEHTIEFTIKKMFTIPVVIIKDFFKYSLPVILNEAAWGFGVTIHAGIIGQISKEQYAAYTISGMVERISVLTMIGFSSAACILLGKAIGEGKDKDTVMQYARTFQGLAGAFALLSALIIFFIRTPIINIFDISDVTKYYADKLLIIVSVLALIKTFNCVSVVGIFRGGGDTKTGMIIDLLAMYLISVPLGAMAKFIFNLEVPFVFMFLLCDELVKLPIFFTRVKSRKWIKKITRDNI